MENEVKKSTSIQYQLTNNKIFNDVFQDWNNFNNLLTQGPEVMKKYFLQEWNKLKESLSQNDELTITDLSKVISLNDFNVTYNLTEKGTHVFYFTFPDNEYSDASSKYIALALTKNCPRYFTLEYSTSFAFDNSTQKLTKRPSWVVGEFFINNNNKMHKNYGNVNNDRLSYFAGFILGILNAENQ